MNNERLIEDWLGDLPEPYRTQALNNRANCLSQQYLNIKRARSGAEAINDAFDWAGTPEKHAYWSKCKSRFIELVKTKAKEWWW
jgi:hypothetical protein